MLPRNMLDAATGAMRSLPNSVLSLEKWRLKEKDVAYPVFAAKVPEAGPVLRFRGPGAKLEPGALF